MGWTAMRVAIVIAAGCVLVACGDDETPTDAGAMPGDARVGDGGRDGATPEDGAVDDAAMGDDAAMSEDAAISMDAAMLDDAAMSDDASMLDDAAMPDDAAVAEDATTPIDAFVAPDAWMGDAAIPEPSLRIAMVRAIDGMLATPIHIDTVQVTYVLEPVGDDPGGVFVQHELLGPALFVAIDPAMLSATPIVRGVYASFSVTETDVVDGQHRVIGIVPGSFSAGTTPVPGIVAEPQDVTTIDVPAQLDALESELTRNRVMAVAPYADCGLDHWCAAITTTGVPAATASYRFRTVQSVIEAYGLQRLCYQEVELTPMWRFTTTAQTSAWVPADLQNIACALPTVIGAVALSPTTLVVVFDAPLDPSTVAASDFTISGGVTAVAASVDGYAVTVTTSVMAPASMHTVMVGAVQDVLGIDISPGGMLGTFRVPAVTGRPNAEGQVVISEIMLNPSGSTETGREWIELYNPSATTTHTLTDCLLRDATGMHTLGTLAIAPGARLTLASGADPGFTEDYVYSGITLGNSGDSVVLECDGVEIDRVDYDGTFQSRDGRALSLDPDLQNAFLDDESTSWCTAITTYATTERGTPGAPNDDCR
ncbi:MAG: lamin tail domain-containing protein [Myxococcota bacterium]|nr:lamin tail domain-containing protein [Myxococcota bacterium]